MRSLTIVACALSLAVAPLDRGPWLLTSLPGMGTLSWGCDPKLRGYDAYTLRFDTRKASATETVTMRVGLNDRIVLSRQVNAAVIPFPRSDSPFRRIDVSQSTEPGTLRATVRIDFRGRPVSPSHCWSYLPPAMTVRLYPR